MNTSIYKQAESILHTRRSRAQIDCDILLDDLRRDRQYKSLEQSIRQLDIDIVYAKDTACATKLKYDRDLLYRQFDEILLQHNLTRSHLKPQYQCQSCQDSGYVNGTMCQCLKTIVRKALIKNNSINLPQCTFDHSRETNKHNIQIYNKCSELCDKLHNSQYRNMLLLGKTGTGKTYLCACISNKLMDNGIEVLFLTSYNLNSGFLRNHLSDISQRTQYLDKLCQVDVLIIDDLGTENHYNNVTLEYLFDVINERTLTDKSTFISTNLSLADIRERYGDRLFSRLSNQSTTIVCQLNGKDKRTTTT